MSAVIERVGLVATQNSDLLHMADVDPLSDSDEACLSELGAVIRKHGLQNRFGVNLLHRHFDVSDNEALVELCDVANRTLTAKPVSIDEVDPSQFVQTSWRFDIVGEDRKCESWCKSTDTGHDRKHDKK